MIKNIVFDLGRVIYTFWPIEYMLELGYTQEDAASLFGCEAITDLWNEYDRGTYTRESLIDEIIKLLPDRAEDIRKILGNDFVDRCIKIMPENLELFYDVKRRGFKVYILSNIFDDGIQHLIKRDAFLSEADGIIASAHYKLLKPEHEIYQVLFDTYNLVPEECVFIDDKECNITAARELGMHGIVFENLEDCKQQLNYIIQTGGNNK